MFSAPPEFFGKLLILISLILISCEITIEDGITYQGVTFNLVGEKSGTEGIFKVSATGDFSEDSIFYKGHAIAIYKDASCTQKISDIYSYDSSSQEIKLESEVNVDEFKQHTLRIGILDDSSSLLKCLNSNIGYLRELPTPTGFSLVNTEDGNIASIRFTNIENNIPQVQFFSDSDCSQDISEKQDIIINNGESNVLNTNALPIGNNEIYAKFWADEMSSICSNDYISFEVKLAPVINVSLLFASNQTPTLKVTGTESGDEVQLFSDSSCSQNISTKTESTGKTLNIIATTSIPQNYTIYAKRWDSSSNESVCSSHIPYYIMTLSQLWSGSYHTCALEASGNIKCWGRGDSGQLGNDKKSHTSYPVTVIDGNGSTTALAKIVQVESGNSHTCALTTSGNVKCWGHISDGRLGYDMGTEYIPQSQRYKDHPINVVFKDGTLLSGVAQISIGNSHSCALTTAGNVKCWGRGAYGRLGNDGTSSQNHPVSVVDKDGGTTALSGAVQVETGYYHTCALMSSGNVKCWGYGGQGQLGNNGTSNSDHPTGVVDGNNSNNLLSNISQISTGNYHSCALTASGNVKCWGDGTNGRLGNNLYDDRSYPVDVITGNDNTLLSDIIQISAGGTFTCALTNSGNVKCWGQGLEGRLGNNSSHNSPIPVTVMDDNNSNKPLSNVIQISSAYSHSCALTSSGNIKCWGRNNYGQLGLGNRKIKQSEYSRSVVDGKDSSTLLQIGTRQVKYNCKDNNCSFNTKSLISLYLKTPIASPSTSSTPTIRIYHASAGDAVSLHSNDDCSSTSLANGTVAANKTTIDLTTSTLTDGQANTIYAKVGTTCSSNSITYTYDSSLSN